MAVAGEVPKKSSKWLLVVLIALVVILAGTTGYFALRPSGGGTGTVTYLIGVEIAVSGPYASDGPLRRDGAFLAIDQMNAALAAAGSSIHFERSHQDSKGTAADALTVFESFVAAGVKVVVGPLSSTEVGAIMPSANSNKVVSISPSSTAPRLAFDDYSFRVAPNDAFQAKALAALLSSQGITKVAVMARNDDYGRGIANLTESIYKAAPYSGQVEKVLYAYPSTDYSSDVGSLSTKVTTFGTGAGTAVLMVAFEDDGVAILNLARQDATLSAVRWFGSESVKRTKFIDATAPAAVKDFLVARNMTGFFPSPAKNPVVTKFEQDYQVAYGKAPSAYAYYSYDAAMLAMLSILRTGKNDGAAIKAILPSVGQTYVGASGQKIFDANGDYAAADYRIWHVTLIGGVYAFTEVGTWFYSTGKIAWD